MKFIAKIYKSKSIKKLNPILMKTQKKTKLTEPRNNPSQVKQFLLKLELNQHKASVPECLQIIDFYQREFGYLNVGWKPGLQLTYMYQKLKNAYDRDFS